MQLVVAGKSHPADDGGKSLIQQMVQLRRRPGGAAPDRVPARLRHGDGPLPLLGLRRLAEQPAAPAGGVRHVRDEVRAQRRAQPVDPRRLVGRDVRRGERLGDPDRRRRRRPTAATTSRPPRSTTWSRPRSRRLLRPRRRRRARPLDGDGAAHARDASARRCWPRGWSATTSSSWYAPAARSAARVVGRRLRRRQGARDLPCAPRRRLGVRGGRRGRRLRAARTPRCSGRR